jgi:NAD(P)-dependent dehydrogenase (short-subunit alcohol dehydrogenase family)
LVNNAGISLHEGNIMNVTQEQFDAQINTNLRGGYFLAQKFIEYFEKNNQSNGSILFVSSERGFYVDDLPYGLTKSAVNSLVQGLAYRVIKKGIRVNAIAPGVTTSDMTGFKSDENLYVSYNANERVYLPEEVAEVACFLLSDVSKCLSGQILVCNESKSVNAHWR